MSGGTVGTVVRLSAAAVVIALLALGAVRASAGLPTRVIPEEAVSDIGDCIASLHVLLAVPSAATLDRNIADAGGTDRWIDADRSLFAGSAEQTAVALGGDLIGLDLQEGEAWVLSGRGDAAIARQLRRFVSEDGVEVWALGDTARQVDCTADAQSP